MSQRVFIPSLGEVLEFQFNTSQLANNQPNSSVGPFFVGQPRRRTVWNVQTISLSFAGIIAVFNAGESVFTTPAKEVQLEAVVTVNGVPTFINILSLKTPEIKKSTNGEPEIETARTLVLESYAPTEIGGGIPLNFEMRIRKYFTVSGNGLPKNNTSLVLKVKEPVLQVTFAQEFGGGHAVPSLT